MVNPGDSDNLFLVAVLELCEKTAGRAVAALKSEGVPALKLPHVSHVRMICERMRAKVLIVDSARPGDVELGAIRLVRASDPDDSLIVVLLGEVEVKALPADICAQVNAYLCKPVEWKTVARTVVQLANNRKPPTTKVVLLRK